MANVTVDIGVGFYESDSLPFANQRCVNLYPNFPQAPALKSSSLFEVQGLNEVVITSRKASDNNRGAWVFDSIPYFINGNFLYRLNRLVNFNGDISYNTSELGRIDGEGLCSMSDNGTQLIIINADGQGYIYTKDATEVVEITDAGFSANGIPRQVVFIDSFFVVTTSDNKAIVSASNDGLNWNALDFFTAEADPDGIVAPFVYKNQLYLLGQETTETYQNIGGAGVPFQRINGFVLSQGCSAPFTVVKQGNLVFWVGRGENEQPVIWAFGGGEPQKISTTAIDNKIHELSTEQVARLFAWSYSVRGHSFVAFSSNDWTFVYDTSTQRWHERESEVLTRNGRVSQRCRIRSVVNAYNELFVGDTEDGRIGIIDENTYSEYELPLISFFTTTPLYDLGNSFSLPMIELLCESGVGNSLKQDPEVRLEISRNGVVFENPRTRYLGKRGNYNLRQIWQKNGRVTRFCVFKVTISDPVKRRLFGLELKFKQGTGSA